MKQALLISRIRASRTISLTAKVCGAITTALVVVFDILAGVAPRLTLYFGLALLVVSIFFVFVTISARFDAFAKKFVGDYWPKPIIVTTFVSSSMFLLWYALSVGAGNDSGSRGILSSNFEVFHAIQKDLGLVENRVSEIAELTASIAEKMDGLKRETSEDPRKELANFGISWSIDSYVSALISGDLSTIDLFLQGGMMATTRHKGSSALLYGLQPELENNPVEILRLFVSHGFDLDTHLVDRRILNHWGGRSLPTMFETELKPEGYTGGYYGGQFVGPALLWVVQLGAYRGFTDDQMQVVHFLLEQGAEARTTFSFLEYSGSLWGDTGPFRQIFPVIEEFQSQK